MPEPLTTAGADYLEQLLRAAINVPAAAADPASGRVVARLMVALGAKGEDERLEPYLSCSPGRPSIYDVTCYDQADRPATWVTHLAAGQAMRAATRFAAARPDRTVAVVARDDTGHERCVLVARGPTATYQFPDQSPELGSPDEGRPGTAEVAVPTGRPDQREGQWAAIAERLASLPTTDEMVSALRDLLAGTTTDLQQGLGSLPTTDEVVRALRELLSGMTTDLRQRLGSLPTTDEVVRALRELLSGMTIELDATAIEDVIYAALDEVPHAPPAAASPTVTASEVDELAAAEVAEVMGDRPAAQPREAGSHINVVPPTVSINASPVADQVSDRLPGRDGHRNSYRRANPATMPQQVSRRPPADRAVADVLALVALSSRRR